MESKIELNKQYISSEVRFYTIHELQKMLELTRKRADLIGSIYDDFYTKGKSVTDCC